MVDPELPVRVQAALALPELIRYEQRGYLPYREIESNNKASESVRTLVAPNIGRIMQGTNSCIIQSCYNQLTILLFTRTPEAVQRDRPRRHGRYNAQTR